MPTRTLTDVVAEHARTLRAAGVPSPEVDARLLASHAAGRDLLRGDGVASPPDGVLDELAQLVRRRAERVPLQLLTGTAWFRQLELACLPGVFIPRPETEIVAGLAIDAARGAGPHPVVVEPCTGTGAIALSVAAEVPGAQVVATDRSAAAVELARANLARVEAGAAGVEGLARGAGCAFLRGDLLAPVDDALRGAVDVLVANPPYLPSADRASWAPEVRDHDPDHALVGGDDGHEVVNRLLGAALTWLRPGGTVVLEIDERRGADALHAACHVGFVDARIEQDLTGADRAVVARRPTTHGDERHR